MGFARRWVLILALLQTCVSSSISMAQDSVGEPSTAAPCDTTITKCGCTIVKPGAYQIIKELNNSDNLNAADQSCIAIKAPRVSLFLNGFAITNSGTEYGVGIHLSAAATNAFVSGANSENHYSVIDGWSVGIEDNADHVALTAFVAQQNNCAGVLVQNADRVSIINFSSNSNGSYGVWLNGATVSGVSTGTLKPSNGRPSIQKNGVAGIYVSGANAFTPTESISACPSGSTTKGKPLVSHNIVISSNTIQNNSGTGILVQTNVSRATINRNTVVRNAGGDLVDKNDNCGSDFWFDNSFTDGTPRICIH